MIFVRVLAQLVDMIACFAFFMLSYLAAPTVIDRYAGAFATPAVKGVSTLVVAVFLMWCAQYPFLKIGQTVGKAFFRLEVVADDPRMPLTVPLMLHRELLCKLASCYLICIPVLFGKPGGHEAATRTRVVWKRRG